MERNTLKTIRNLSLSLFILAGYSHYIDYKENKKFKKERDIILDNFKKTYGTPFSPFP
jgi:hypothetical protein